MEKTEQSIMKAYREGDLGERLNLFMTYRDLREEFTDIEQSAPESSVSEKPACCRTDTIRRPDRERTEVDIPLLAGMRSRLRGWICGC